jgi:GNAT superfamily N-acetyltransferase
VLRPATAADAEAIARLHAESWRRTYRGMMPDAFLDHGALANRRQVWRERLRSPADGRFLRIAEDDLANGNGAITGFICAFADHDPLWGAYIDNLHVAYSAHRRGVGSILMRSVGEWLLESGRPGSVYLWVMEANAGARRFYERLGALDAGTEMMSDPGGGSAPNCRYVWPRADMLLGVMRQPR